MESPECGNEETSDEGVAREGKNPNRNGAVVINPEVVETYGPWMLAKRRSRPHVTQSEQSKEDEDYVEIDQEGQIVNGNSAPTEKEDPQNSHVGVSKGKRPNVQIQPYPFRTQPSAHEPARDRHEGAQRIVPSPPTFQTLT